jgi:hypothetical protein
MPVAVELLKGTIALVGESRLLDEKYHISIARSSDNWAVPLGMDEHGPVDRDDNMFPGAAPYICQFPTGETLLAYNGDFEGRRLRFLARLGNENARDFGPPRVAFNTRGYWGSACIDSSRTALLAFPEILPDSAPKTDSGAIHIARFWLNRDITVSPGGDDANDNANALFIGSDSQAQAVLRFYGDATHLRIRAGRLDNFPIADDALTLRFTTGKGTKDILTLKVAHDGLAPNAPAGVTAEIRPTGKKRLGVVEIKIPCALLADGEKNGLRIYPILHNRDTPRGKVTADTLTGADPARPATWPAIRFAPVAKK